MKFGNGFLLSYSDFEFLSAFGTADIVRTLSAFDTELCFAVLALYIFVSFSVSYLVFLADKEVFDSAGNFVVRHILFCSLIKVFGESTENDVSAKAQLNQIVDKRMNKKRYNGKKYINNKKETVESVKAVSTCHESLNSVEKSVHNAHSV